MPDEGFTDRARAAEDDYFRKKDLELIQKMKQASAAEQGRRELAARLAVSNPEVLEELGALGFTPETVALLPFVPIVQTAWAEGGVSPEERKLIVDLARARGIDAGSPGDRLLSDWLAHRPSAEVFARAMRLIRAILDAGGVSGGLTADDVIQASETIAAASGGIFGLRKISSEERSTLNEIASALKGKRP
jgi:hypothetical protein